MRLGVGFGMLVVTAGCASNGQQWIADVQHPGLPTDAAPPPAAAEPSTDRARLKEVVSLGEVDAFSGEAALPAAPTVVVNVNQSPVAEPAHPAPSYYPTSTVWVPVAPLPSRPVKPRARSPRIGQDWPAPESHGPSFPYKTGPADPWQDERERE